MPAINRYILIELMKVFVLAVLALTAVLLLSDVTKELQNQGLGFTQIVMVLPYLLPYAVRTAMQGALLFAVCTVYGRMAATNEIVAVKSMGISPMKLVWPTIWLVAVPMSLGCVLLDDLGATGGRSGIDYVIVNSTDEVAYGMLRKYRSFSKKHFAIAVKGVEGRRLIRPTLTYEPPGEAKVVTITAQEGELRVDRKSQRLVILLRSGRGVVVPDELDETAVPGQANGSAVADKLDAPAASEKLKISFEDTIEQTLPLDTSLHRAVTPKLIFDQRARVASLRKALAEKKPRSLADHAQVGLYQTAVQRIRTEERYLNWMQTKFHQKWANSFCCLAFAAIGIPVAVQMRRGDFLTSFMICFLPIVSAYQPLQFVGSSLAQAGEVPAYAVWFGNVILFAVAALLLRRMEKH